jgi:transcription antitermination factor NusG
MTASAVEQVHQKELEDWKTRGVSGMVASVDPSGSHLIMTVRSQEGPKPVTVDLANVKQYTRYSPENPKNPVESKLADIQAGDQVRVLGSKSEDGATVTAEKVYSGSFRTLAATVASVAPDGKTMVVNDLQTKKPVTVELTDDSAVRQMPPQMAMMLARRLNPSLRSAQGAGAAGSGGGHWNGNGGTAPGGQPSNGQPPSPAGASPAPAENPSARNPGASAAAAAEPGSGGPGSGARGSGMARGDLTQMIERLPKIPVSDLKPGQAVVVSGGAANANAQLVATNIISGVEPILQSAPSRGGNSALNSMWSLGDLSVPGE